MPLTPLGSCRSLETSRCNLQVDYLIVGRLGGGSIGGGDTGGGSRGSGNAGGGLIMTLHRQPGAWQITLQKP